MNLDSFWDALCALIILGVLVESITVLYRLGTASDSRLYCRVLRDACGPWTENLTNPGAVWWCERGPFQFIRLRPQGTLSVLTKLELLHALEDQTPGWFRRTFATLRTEMAIQRAGYPGFSPMMNQFLQELRAASENLSEQPRADEKQASPCQPGREEAYRFFSDWKMFSDSRQVEERLLPAEALLIGFRRMFFPGLQMIEENYSRICDIYFVELRRRTIRQRLLISGCVLVWLVFIMAPVGVVFPRASITIELTSAAALVALLTLTATILSRCVPSGRTVVSRTPEPEAGVYK